MKDTAIRYVIGIDPSYSSTGIAILEYESELPVAVGKLTLETRGIPKDMLMNKIAKSLLLEADKYNSIEIIMEDGFMGVNVGTGLQLATLRGGIISAFFFMKDILISHMLPTEIRKAMGLMGNAKKEEVAAYLTELYKDCQVLKDIGPYSDKKDTKKKKTKTSDMYDAVGIALAYIKKSKGLILWD